MIFYSTTFSPLNVTEYYHDPVHPLSITTSLLPTPAVTVMVLWLFVSRANESPILHPLQALGLFLKLFATMDWGNIVLTANDIIGADDVASGLERGRMSPPPTSHPLVRDTFALLMNYRTRYQHTIIASQRSREDVEDVDLDVDLSGDRSATASSASASAAATIGGNGARGWNSPTSSSTELNAPGGLFRRSNSFGSSLSIPGQQTGNASDTMSMSQLPPPPPPRYQRCCINILDPVHPALNLCSKVRYRILSYIYSKLQLCRCATALRRWTAKPQVCWSSPWRRAWRRLKLCRRG